MEENYPHMKHPKEYGYAFPPDQRNDRLHVLRRWVYAVTVSAAGSFAAASLAFRAARRAAFSSFVSVVWVPERKLEDV
jgi:hypothetical protein